MEVASSSSATGKNSRLEFSPDWNLAFARLRSPLAFQWCLWKLRLRFSYTRPDAHTRKPRSGVRGWRLRTLNLNDAPRMCTQRGAEAPSGAPYRAGSRPSGPTRPRQRRPRLGRSCLRVLPRAGARPSGTRSPRQRRARLGRSCLQSRCAPVGYEEPERMPEVPQTWMVEGPPSQPKPSPGRASVPQGSLPSPKRSILM